MVYVPSAERHGFSLKLHEDVMRDLLNSGEVKAVLAAEGQKVRAGVVEHVQATASAENAANYVAALFREDSFSDDYGFEFDGAYSLGNRPIVVIGVPAGRGSIPGAKPPLLTESQHHPLTSVAGFTAGGGGEDVR